MPNAGLVGPWRSPPERVLRIDLEQLAAEGSCPAHVDDAPRAALAECLGKLRPGDRDLIERRYTPGVTAKQIAADLGRPANSVSKSLGRIRRMLLECIERTLRAAARLSGETPLQGGAP